MVTISTPIIYGTAWKKTATVDNVYTALCKGFRGIDTACQPKHYNEGLVGAGIAKFIADGRGQRSELFIQTKFTSVESQDPKNIPYDPTLPVADQVLASFNVSLVNLQTTYIDSYVLHGPYGYPGLSTDDWAVWSVMEKLVKDGKVKQLGISNVNTKQLEELVQKASVKPSHVQNR